MAYQTNIQWQLALSDYVGKLDNHYPRDQILSFLKATSWVWPKRIRDQPLADAETYFTDGNGHGKASIHGPISKTPYTSTQKAELAAIIELLHLVPASLNIVTDSQYVWFTVLNIETAHIVPQNELHHLFFFLFTRLNMA